MNDESPHKAGTAAHFTPEVFSQFLNSIRSQLPPPMDCFTTVVAVERLATGYNNTTFRVTLDSDHGHRDIACRVSKLSSWPKFKVDGEVATIRYVRSQDPYIAARVPEVLFSEDEVPGVTDGFVVIGMQWVKGSNITPEVYAAMSVAAQTRLAHDLALFLRALQRVPVPKQLGRIAAVRPQGDSSESLDVFIDAFFDFGCNANWPNKGPFDSPYDFWAEMLRMRRSQIEELQAAQKQPDAMPEEAAGAAFEQWLACVDDIAGRLEVHKEQLTQVPIVLCHFDYCGRNWHVDLESGELIGVVDWEWGCTSTAAQDWFEGFDDVGQQLRDATYNAARNLDARMLPAADAVRFNKADEVVTLRNGFPEAARGAAVGEAVAFWLFRVVDVLFPWELSAYMAEPAKFPHDAFINHPAQCIRGYVANVSDTCVDAVKRASDVCR